MKDTDTETLPLRRRHKRTARGSTSSGNQYDGFISYSHALDGKFGPALQREVEAFAKPWYAARARRLFRDNANLAASSDLWQEIEVALASSEWLILLASPKAAESEWVDQEVKWWLDNRSASRILIVLTSGEFSWLPKARGIDRDNTTSIPPTLLDAMTTEPRLVDLRTVRDAALLDRANPTFRDGVVDIAAAVSGVPKDELVGEHVKRRRQTLRWVRGIIAALTILIVLALISAGIARSQRDNAQRQTLAALSRQLGAEALTIRDTRPNLARQLLLQGYRFDTNEQVVGTIIESASIPREVFVPGYARDVAFDTRRSLLALASDEGVTLYDPNTMRTVTKLPSERGYIQTVSFNQQAALMADAGANGSLRLWDVKAAKNPVLLSSLQIRSEIVEGLVFLGDRPYVAAISGGAVVSIIDISNTRRPRVLTSLKGSPNVPITRSVSTSPDGQLLAASGENGSVRLWDLADPAAPNELASFSESVVSLDFSGDGRFLAAGGSDDVARLWDISQPAQPVLRASFNGQSLGIDAVAFTSDSTVLGLAAGDGSIELWDVSDSFRPKLGSRLTGRGDSIDSIAFSRDGKTLASISASGVDGESSGPTRRSALRLWSVVGAERTGALTTIKTSGSAMKFSPDGHTMAGGSPTSMWDITERSQPRTVSTIPTLMQGSSAIDMSPDGRILATGQDLELWEVSVPTRPRRLTKAKASPGAAMMIFNPNGRMVANEGEGGAVQLWDVSNSSSPQRASLLAGSKAGTQSTAFRPDGQIIATRGDGVLQIWDIAKPASPALAGTISITAESIESAAFSPDGDRLITGTAKGGVSVWDLREPAHPRLIATVVKHTGAVLGLAVRPNGTMVASASTGGEILLWALDKLGHLSQLASLRAGGPYDPAWLSFTADGQTLATSSQEATNLWDIDVSAILGRLCAQSTDMSEAEWRERMPDRPYDPPCSR